MIVHIRRHFDGLKAHSEMDSMLVDMQQPIRVRFGRAHLGFPLKGHAVNERLGLTLLEKLQRELPVGCGEAKWMQHQVMLLKQLRS